MSEEAGPKQGGRGAKLTIAWFGGCFLLLNLLLRLVLLIHFLPPGLSLGAKAEALVIGTIMDAFVLAFPFVPMLAYWAIFPARWQQSRLHRWSWLGGLTVFWAIAIFLVCAEFFFFEEFKSRFNTVSVDYLLYPHEVFTNIWDAYPVGWVLAGCVLFAVGWTWVAARWLRGGWADPPSRRQACVGLAICALWLGILWPFVGSRLTRFSPERTLNEIAGNGWFSGVQAALTRELEYTPFYRTLSLDEAYARTRKLLAEPGTKLVEDPRSIERRVEGDPTRPRLNVVLLLEESLGSEFFGCLGRPGPSLTPELDQLAQSDAWLFTHLYASGNRTVRGMEAVLCSFPPLPGDSIVVRSGSQQFETVARVLQRDGYATRFIYAGRGLFDNLQAFMAANGFDKVLERGDFAKPAFETVWGVCNEDLYDRGLQEARALHHTGQPFFLSMLSVSNHKPFTFPKGRIPEDPDKRRRNYAVKYTDYAIGRFFRMARQEPFWTNTLFVVVADHGARVYGEQTIPMKSYEIPLFILGPAIVKEPRRINIPGGQVDVAPTLLGLIRRPYDSVFFGRDLFKAPPDYSRAFLHHNRDIGLYEPGAMAVLGMNKTVEFFRGDPKLVDPVRVNEPTEAERRIELDAEALFQVADDLYQQRRFRIPQEAPPAVSSARR